MVKTYILVIILLITGVTGHAQGTEETKIKKILDNQASAWSAGNMEAFMQDYWKNDSLMFVGKKGITYGYENNLRRYKTSYATREAMGKLSLEIIHLQKMSAAYYWVAGKYTVTRSAGDLEGYFTLVLRKIRGVWVIISDHSS